MALKLSIVVPVYNVEKYIGKCLDSLLNQDLNEHEYEIIVIDDGSTDRSPEICDVYANREPRIRVIHQLNQGLSVARNVGVDSAQGVFIQFVDSDDYLEKNVLGSLVDRMMQDNLDVLRFGYQLISESGKVTRQSPVLSQNRIVSGKEYLDKRLGIACYAWQFILSKSFLISNKLYFKPGIIFEDTVWTPIVLLEATRVSEIDLLVYNYLQREGSITQAITPASRKRKQNGMLSLVDEMCLQREGVESKSWYNTIITHIVVALITDISVKDYNDRHELLAQIKEKRVFPLSTRGANRKGKRKIQLINFSLEFACMLIHFYNRK